MKIKFKLDTVYAEIIRDALSEQYRDIKKRLLEQSHVYRDEEVERLKKCVEDREFLYNKIMHVLNEGSGTINFKKIKKTFKNKI